MNKKIFALASVTALGGLVAGLASTSCTSTTTYIIAGADAGDAGPSGRPPKGSSSSGGESSSGESSSGESSSGESSSGGSSSGGSSSGGKSSSGGSSSGFSSSSSGSVPSSCIVSTPIDTSGLPYVTALYQAGACTTAETAALDKFLDDAIASGNTNFTQSQWAAVVSKTCASCVFTSEGAAKWGPILNSQANPDEFAGYDFGGCVELKSSNFACGKAYHAYMTCQLAACNSQNCQTDQEISECLQDPALQDNICASQVDAVVANCGANVNTYAQACAGGIATWLKVHCVAK